MNSEPASFSKNFQKFIEPHFCQQHKSHPTFVCIEKNCQNKGLICSLCLTIKGRHKNHDALQITQFMQSCTTIFQERTKKRQTSQFIFKLEKSYQQLLKIVTDFHENFSQITKRYISTKNQQHNQTQYLLSNQGSMNQFKECKFKSFEEMNKYILNLINKMFQSKLQTSQSQRLNQKNILQKAKYYLEDLNYQIISLGKQLKNTQIKLSALLEANNNSPVVLSYSQAFYEPKFQQNQDIIYIGQTKLDKPNGKGICYYKESKKIFVGNFVNGQLEGKGQMYFQTGDLYLGQFKNNKKQGRGIYNWAAEESTKYQGQFKDGKRSGRGTLWWQDGSRYYGQFKQGLQSGYGILYREDNQKQYEGNWYNGMFDGQGTQYFQNGQRFQGSFKQDKFYGPGVLYKQGEVIHGVWKNNQLQTIKSDFVSLQKN